MQFVRGRARATRKAEVESAESKDEIYTTTNSFRRSRSRRG